MNGVVSEGHLSPFFTTVIILASDMITQLSSTDKNQRECQNVIFARRAITLQEHYVTFA